MFHRPSGIPPTSNIQHGGTSAIDLSSHRQNENMIPPHSGSTNKNSLGGGGGINKESSNVEAKTPANKGTSIRRRALGDISNKKQTGVGGVVGVGATGFNNRKDALKPRSSTVPSSSGKTNKIQDTNNRHQVAASTPRKAIQISLIPNSSRTTALPSATISASHRKAVAVPLTSSAPQSALDSAKNANISLVKPTETIKPLQHSKSAPAGTDRLPVVRIDEAVPDVELPAGRTWRQQLEYDLLDEDDIASTSSIDSFHPKDRTMWADWGDSLWTRHLAQERKESEEEALEADRLVRDQIEKMLDREAEEEQRGLEALYDVIDNMDFLGDASLVDLDLALPASSRCGGDEDGDLLDNGLLFEL